MDNLTHSKHEGFPTTSNKLDMAQSTNKIKILVVEDSFLTRRVLHEMLDILGYSADFAEDGKTALACYEPTYALILMDIDLPDFTGIEVTETIRKVEKEQHFFQVPIIAITSHYGELSYRAKCKKAGMNGCSNKPNLAQLKKWISKYVDTKQPTH